MKYAEEPPTERWFATATKIVCAIFFALIVALVVAGCAVTVAPKPVIAEQASFDNNEQNSGIIMSTPSGFVVTDNFRLRYNRLIATYGADLATPATTDAGIAPIGPDRWLITKQRMIDFLEMNAWRKAGLAPKNPNGCTIRRRRFE